MRLRVYMHTIQLWSMFPCFCVAPTDLTTAFGTLAPVLANAMQDTRYPDLLPEVPQRYYNGFCNCFCNVLILLSCFS
jgi:NUC173 domain